MSNLQPNCCLEFDFEKVDQHAGGKWLIRDTKRHKDNQFTLKIGPQHMQRDPLMTRWCCLGIIISIHRRMISNKEIIVLTVTAGASATKSN